MSDLTTFFEKKEYEKVVLAVNAIEAPTTEQRALRAQSLFAQKKWSESLGDFRHVLQTQGPMLPFHIFQKTRASVVRAKLEPAQMVEFWRSCSDTISREMGTIIDAILSGQDIDIEYKFKVLIKEIFDNPDLEERWLVAFRLLVAGCRGEPVTAGTDPQPRRKIIVSGMGWSGSGAIYAYLREFAEVYPVGGESSALEGNGGFRAFVSSKKDKTKTLENTVDFFFKNLLGYAPMRNSSCIKEIRGAREFITHPEWAMTYADGVQHVVVALVNLFNAIETSEDEVENKLQKLGDSIADNLIAFVAPKDKVALLDNCIHIPNLNLAKYLENTFILCCLRDPRSNYVALKREFPGFSEDINLYIENQEKNRKKIEGLFAKAEPVKDTDDRFLFNDSNVQLVQFEKFILSPALRESMVRWLELDTAGQKKFDHFKPWASAKNTMVHQDFANQDEIKLIEQHLTRHCVEPTLQPFTLSPSD